MCARYSVSGERVIKDLFGLDDRPVIQYNAAPTDAASIAVSEGNSVKIEIARWGLRPSWSKRPLINAKTETVLVQGAFKEAFASCRCLVPATAFFEWETTLEGKKVPHLFRMADGDAFALAGFWQDVKGGIEFCLLTTEPNALLARIHDRMPAIIKREDFDDYLRSEPKQAQAIALEPFPVELMSSYLVNPRMSSSKYKAADCIEAI